MPSSVDFSGRPFHFIGIGGIGMSALAYILAKRKLPVYGSDIKSSHITERLQEMGAHIFWRQDASNFEVFETSPNSLGSNGAPELAASSAVVGVGAVLLLIFLGIRARRKQSEKWDRDAKGTEIIPPLNSILIDDITGSSALVRNGREHIFVDLGNGPVDTMLFATTKGYEHVEPFRCGCAMVKVDDRWFYIDTAGNALFNETFDFAETFHHDRANGDGGWEVPHHRHRWQIGRRDAL